MPDFVRFPLVLVIVCGISAVVLGGLNAATEPIIRARREAAAQEAVKVVLPGAARISEKTVRVTGSGGAEEEIRYAEGYASESDEKAGRPMGYAADGHARGYQSEIAVKAGFRRTDSGLEVLAVRVVSQAETPGIGTKIEEVKTGRSVLGLLQGKTYPDPATVPPWFPEQFQGLPAGKARLKPDGGAVDGITGATISSRAVASAVQDAANRLQRALAAEGAR